MKKYQLLKVNYLFNKKLKIGYEKEGLNDHPEDFSRVKPRNNKNTDILFKLMSKISENKTHQNQLIEKLNMNKLEIIEENEKEEKIFDQEKFLKSNKKPSNEDKLATREKQIKNSPERRRKALNVKNFEEFKINIKNYSPEKNSSQENFKEDKTKDVVSPVDNKEKIQNKNENNPSRKFSTFFKAERNSRKYSVNSFASNNSNETLETKDNINVSSRQELKNKNEEKNNMIVKFYKKSNTIKTTYNNKNKLKSQTNLYNKLSSYSNKEGYRFSILKNPSDLLGSTGKRFLDDFKINKKINIESKLTQNESDNHFKIKNKKGFLTQKLSLPKVEVDNYDFIRNFNLRFEKEKKTKKDIILSNNSQSLETKSNQTNGFPQINKLFDFNNINKTPEKPHFSSSFTSNIKRKLDNSFNDKDLDTSVNKSRLSINIKKSKERNSNSNKQSNHAKHVKEIYGKINLNEKKLKKIKKKIEKFSPDGQEKVFKTFNLKNETEFKTEILGNLRNFIIHKRDKEVLKYDFMTRLDNGLLFKEDLKMSLLNKLVPGNYLNCEKPFKIEILQPKFIKSKFNKILPAVLPGKPIVKNSDELSKEYCYHYERKNLPKVVKDKDAFSVMTIFK